MKTLFSKTLFRLHLIVILSVIFSFSYANAYEWEGFYQHEENIHIPLFEEQNYSDMNIQALMNGKTISEGHTSSIIVLYRKPTFIQESNPHSLYLWKSIPNTNTGINDFLDETNCLIQEWITDYSSNMSKYDSSKDCVFYYPDPTINGMTKDISLIDLCNEELFNFKGKQYYSFNTITMMGSTNKSYPVNLDNGQQMKYVTLFCECYPDVYKKEKTYYYANLPLPVGGIQRNRVYIYILNDSFNFFEFSRTPGSENSNRLKTNTNKDFTLFEYSLESGKLLNL